VHGPVRVTVEHPEVEELLYGGDEAGSWLNRLLRSVNAVRAGAPGARDDLTNLRDGVVRASGFALTHRLAGKLAGNEAAPPAEPRPDAAFQDARLPDADLTVVEARASQADLTVAEHYDARQSAEVVGSGPAGAGQTGRPAPLGRLTWDNGEMDQLPAPVLVGRDVGADEAVVAGHLGALVPRGQTDSMSRVHAELRRQGAGVAIVDRGSTNGTFLWDEQRGAWQRLVPGEPRELRNGAVIAFGERTATFEASR
jgi:hypothetical protein